MRRELVFLVVAIGPFWIGAYIVLGWRGVLVMALAAIGTEMLLVGAEIVQERGRR